MLRAAGGTAPRARPAGDRAEGRGTKGPPARGARSPSAASFTPWGETNRGASGWASRAATWQQKEILRPAEPPLSETVAPVPGQSPRCPPSPQRGCRAAAVFQSAKTALSRWTLCGVHSGCAVKNSEPGTAKEEIY